MQLNRDETIVIEFRKTSSEVIKEITTRRIDLRIMGWTTIYAFSSMNDNKTSVVLEYFIFLGR